MKRLEHLFLFKAFLLSLTVILLTCRTSTAQEFNYKVNAMYIYYFAKYVNWTDVVQGETLTIGVLGNSPVMDQLKALIANKKVYGKSIVIKRIDVTEAKSCNMIIVSRSETGLTQKLCESLNNKPVLVITEKEGYSKKGAQICIYVDDEDDFKTKFELSRSNIEKSKLKVSHELVALGELVN